jgi:fatty acid desaturase
VLTSRNLRGGVLMSTITGGLSLQIEHHLFPGMSRPNLAKVQPLVMEHCRANGIPYVEVSTVSAWARVIRYLNGVGGHIRGSFRCPVDEQCGRS